jgi:hypothetical protein
MITIYGPDWPSTRKLREACANAEIGPKDVSVCYGARTREGALNSTVRLDGVEQLTKLKEAGVKVPDFTIHCDEASDWVNEGDLVFGRARVHTQGRDIVGPGRYIRGRFNRRWMNSEWWSKVVPDVKEEWRIHIFKRPNGKYRSIARGLKHQTDVAWRVMPVRNRANGWTMRHDINPPESVRESARASVVALGYDFGAVDLLHTENGSVYVLEVNKAPGLDDYTCAAYVDSIVRWTV